MKKLIISLLAAGAVAGAAAAPAAAAPQSPAKACLPLLETGLFTPASSQGACRSTTATGSLEDHGAPSNAAFIDNCKQLEAGTFQDYTPEDGRAYPYQFYWFVPDMPAELRSQLYAKNRAGCVAVLKRVHGGLLGGPPA